MQRASAGHLRARQSKLGIDHVLFAYNEGIDVRALAGRLEARLRDMN